MGLTETVATNILVELAAALAALGNLLVGCSAILFVIILEARGEI